MPRGRMHADEAVVSPVMAAGLVAAQFPEWSGLTLADAGPVGTDNRLYRLGAEMVLRFPRTAATAAAVSMEARWLPVIAPHLPLEVPFVMAVGRPSPGYPHPWSVLRWINGTDALAAPPDDELATARTLAGFVAALRAVPVPEDAPRMAEGRHLHPRDNFMRQMIARISDEADPAAVTRLWEAALALPVWDGVPVLVHADLHPLNILTQRGAISSVIDWGGFCAGDPAHDLICGWTVLGSPGRAVFRDLLAVDDATWARGRALAFSKAVMAAPYYRHSNPSLRDVMQATLSQTMADWPG